MNRQQPRTEREIVDTLVSALRESLSSTVIALGREISSHGRARADVAFLIDDEVWAVEVKKTDWRRAIAQAVLNRYAFDRSLIGLWRTELEEEIVDEAERWGIGVIGIQPGGAEVLIPAAQNIPDPSLRDRVVVRLERLAE